jgi:outer membrane protein OmpA-like peptidoglycan-associated protein
VPIAEQLNQAAEEFVIEVIGHTDSTASAEHNRKLSLARALSVYDELIRLGVDKRRLVASGKGEHEPIASNDTEEGKRRNRRIEFKLRKKSGPADPAPQPESAPDPKLPPVPPAPAEPNPFIVPEEGTPAELDLRIDRTRPKQSIQLDLIQFASDSPALTDDIRIVLRHIAPQLIAAEAFTIEVVGHTDDTASAAHNQKLSQARAQSVADELIRLGVPAERLAVSGRGEYEPIAPNSTEEGKRKNRRIEFKLTKK